MNIFSKLFQKDDQTIKDHFLMLPDLDLETKQAILDNNHDEYLLDVIDLKNRYIRYETNTDGGGVKTEIKGYPLTRNQMIVVVNRIEWNFSFESLMVQFYRIGQSHIRLLA